MRSSPPPPPQPYAFRMISSKRSPRERLTILDVGHGNCSVLEDSEGVVVVDAGEKGAGLVLFLLEQGISHVDTLILSHADKDHIAGALQLMSEPAVSVGEVRLNSDAQKGSAIWKLLRIALEDAAQRGCSVVVGLHASMSGRFDKGDVRVEVLAPRLADALSGVGAHPASGGPRMTGNSLSAVIRLSRDGEPIALLPGDIDISGLASLVGRSQPGALTAPIAVFPHHGGLPGASSPEALRGFAQMFCRAVQPEHVVFSIGRGRHATPRPEIVDAIRSELDTPHIACTQLSKRCAALAIGSSHHIAPVFARGRASGTCCAGSLVVTTATDPVVNPHASHVSFVLGLVEKPLCMRPEPTAEPP